jgi:phage terminase large subunit GpA-like protein
MSEMQAAASGRAFWRATTAGEPGVASWCGLEALAAPLGWRPWPGMVVSWLAAQGDDEKLRIFYNNLRGLPYQDTLRSDVGADTLQQRAEAYDAMTCPAGGLLCVAGVDTQDNRLAVTFRAFGRGEESWGVWHSEIYGDTSSPETWEKLRQLLESPIRHASGHTMRVEAAAIDAGGHRGEDVYAFCRAAKARGKHWFPIRGAKSYDAPMLGKPRKHEFTWRGKPARGGVELRWVGTQAIKTLIDGRLKNDKPGTGYYHFPLSYQRDYFKQMRAERREWRRDRQGKKALWWVKGSDRNESWDCEVYCYAAFLYTTLGQHPDTVWRVRERKFARPVIDQAAVMTQTTVDDQPQDDEQPKAPPAAPAPQEAPAKPSVTPPHSPAPPKKKRSRIRGGFGIGGQWKPW